MKPHDTFVALAAMAMDEPLAPPDRAHLAEHLRTCATCAREVARMRTDAREYTELAVPPLAGIRRDEILAAALRSRVELHPARILLVAALLGLLLIGSLAAGSQLIRRNVDLAVVPPVPSGTALPAMGSPSPAASPTAIPTPSPVPSPAFVLNEGPATGGCDAIGVDFERLTWRIDPSAEEPVTARTDTGGTLLTYWAPGFTAGTGDERLIRDPAGVIVVRDGDQLRVGERLAGYFVCIGPTKLHVYTTDPQ